MEEIITAQGGLKPWRFNHLGHSVLAVAVQNRRVDLVRRLLELGVDPAHQYNFPCGDPRDSILYHLYLAGPDSRRDD